MNYYERRVIVEKKDKGKIEFIREGRKASIKIILAMTAMKYLKK